MKKLVLTALLAACAVSVFAQGTVAFSNRQTGSLITYVYSGGTSQIVGNGATDTPAGSTDWAGFTKVSGNGFSAQILSAPGAGAAEGSLVAQSVVTTFRTGGAAGNFAVTTATLANVAPDANVATLMVVAWDNKGGLYTDWASAQAAWQAGLTSAGKSGPFNVDAIGGAVNPAPLMLNLKSFNIYPIPEPATMALVGLGAASMLIFRRRK